MATSLTIKPVVIFCWIAMGCQSSPSQQTQTLSADETRRIGEKIFRNECAGNFDCLTSWNPGEAFASLGIGHFIWYPERVDGPFRESFPALLTHLKNRKVTLPVWLTPDSDCPWNSRAEFLQDRDSKKMQELKNFLRATIPQQTEFLIIRLKQSLPEMLKQIPDSQKDNLLRKFQILMQSPEGRYALTDYVNFKGEGTLVTERYAGQGWGLLQVLQEMNDTQNKRDAVERFAAAAGKVLTRRVENAPPERNERKWLNGWLKRLGTYSVAFHNPAH